MADVDFMTSFCKDFTFRKSPTLVARYILFCRRKRLSRNFFQGSLFQSSLVSAKALLLCLTMLCSKFNIVNTRRQLRQLLPDVRISAVPFAYLGSTNPLTHTSFLPITFEKILCQLSWFTSPISLSR